MTHPVCPKKRYSPFIYYVEGFLKRLNQAGTWAIGTHELKPGQYLSLRLGHTWVKGRLESFGQDTLFFTVPELVAIHLCEGIRGRLCFRG